MEMQNKIKELRSERGLSQSKLADMVEVRRETIVHLENNKYNPSLKLAYQIAKVFELPLEKVIWFE